MTPSLRRAMASLVSKHEKIELELARLRQELRADLENLPKNLTRAVEYLQDHVFDPDLNVSALKRQCQLRDNNFSIRFRSHFGVTPREYIEALRMEAADQLLRSSDFEIYLVATSVGYDRQETFFRAFQRHFGCPPSVRRSSSSAPRQKERQERSVR